jgi:hypothetical protein
MGEEEWDVSRTWHKAGVEGMTIKFCDFHADFSHS